MTESIERECPETAAKLDVWERLATECSNIREAMAELDTDAAMRIAVASHDVEADIRREIERLRR